MRTSLLVALLGSLLSQGCQDSQLDGKKATGSSASNTIQPATSQADASNAANIDPNSGITTAEGLAIPGQASGALAPGLPPAASIPVAIGGAYLSCGVSVKSEAKELLCESRSADKQLSDAGLSTVYVVTGKELKWTALDIKQSSVGIYTATLPPAVEETFNVIVKNNKGAVAPITVGKGQITYTNLIRDPNFESLIAGRELAWDLSPRSISQTIPTQPGHLYIITLSYRYVAESDSNRSDRRIMPIHHISFDQALLPNSDKLSISDGSEVFTATQAARGKTSVLKFDFKDEFSFRGTILSDVKVYDLGSAN